MRISDWSSDVCSSDLETAARLGGSKATYTLFRPWMMRLAGLFNRTIRELVEMQYQNDRDYFFDSKKFCTTFGFRPTTYETGIKEVLAFSRETDTTGASA